MVVQAMAIADNLFLLVSVVPLVSRTVFVYLDQSHHWINPFINFFSWPLVCVTQLATIWITVLVAFSRYVAICHPFGRRSRHDITSLTAVKIQVATAAVIKPHPRNQET